MNTPGRDRDNYAIQMARSTPRRVFIFCDGTWQDGVNSGHAPTNIATLARCIEPIADDGYIQMSYYDSGVGNVTSKPAQLFDGATGRGISNKIRNAYSFLSHNYNFAGSDDDTEIYLFGFSRGAFAVQCLASLISNTGLLRSTQLYYLRGLFALWSNQNFKPWLRGGSGESFVAAELDSAVADLKPVLRRVKIKALVVYDTVSALGLPNPFTARPISFVGKQVPKNVQYAFQALALDERRAAFEPVVWERVEDNKNETSRSPPRQSALVQDDSGTVATIVKQCWFLGGHGDIGGNGDAALGAVTLLWVIGLLREYTMIAFDDREILRHLKHRLLEWHVRIPKVFGTFRDKSKLSTISNSGKITGAEIYWWLLGLKSRRSILDLALRAPTDNMSIHFTVRLAMAAKRNRCRLLEACETKLFSTSLRHDQPPIANAAARGEDGLETTESFLMKWCLPGKETGMPEDAVSNYERVLLETWTKIGTANDPSIGLGMTDRTEFIMRRRYINERIENGVESLHRDMDSFSTFLSKDMQFTGHNELPSPSTKWPLSK